jgi:hypothetical protein
VLLSGGLQPERERKGERDKWRKPDKEKEQKKYKETEGDALHPFFYSLIILILLTKTQTQRIP